MVSLDKVVLCPGCFLDSYLEDHPINSKWLITMVSFRPLSRVGLVVKWPKWLINGGY